MADPRPRVTFTSEGHEITHRQMEALAALHERGSMKKAAEALGVSTPVLFKYVREIEEKSGSSLVVSSSRGSKLTPAGLELLARFRAYELRLQDEGVLRVAGTAVSEQCVLMAATQLSDRGKECAVTISTDDRNLRLVEERRVDCVILDDVLSAMDRYSDVESVEIGSDVLMHKETGPSYLRLAFGAQRLGFRYLEDRGIRHEVVRKAFEPSMVDHTDLSYFVNRSLVRTGVVKALGSKEEKWSVHSIVALKAADHEHADDFLAEARGAWLYRKG